jgi:hypothetical protein
VPLQRTRRVSRASLCPICSRGSWCIVARDGRYAVCMRVESTRPARGGGGGWVHRLSESSVCGAPMETPPTLETPTRPTAEHLHRVYRRLQVASCLQERHAAALLQRGYTPEEIQQRGYRTLPLAGRWKIAKQCHNGTPNDLVGVPGFFVATNNAGTDSYWSLAGLPGLLIPCLAPNGEIRAFRIRPDDRGRDGGKYRWLSSAHRSCGAGSGVHCHVARPLSGNVLDDAIWIVEGEIKADLSAERLGAVALGIPGVSLWSRALADLAELLPQGGRVVMALDSDLQENPAVHEAMWCLAQAAQALGYRGEIALWNPQWNGLDDLLVTGQKPELHPPNHLPEPKWPIKLSSRILAEVPPRTRTDARELAEMRHRLREILAEKLPCC